MSKRGWVKRVGDVVLVGLKGGLEGEGGCEGGYWVLGV